MKAVAVERGYSHIGTPRITFEITDKDFLNSELLDGRDLELTVKQFRKKRSLDANGYMWKLCDMIADKIHATKEEIYREAVRCMGVWKDFKGLTQSEASTLSTAWGMLGTGWVTEQVDFDKAGDKVTIRCYYGTSQYNTKQMSRVIDSLVQDAKALGIETLTPAELERLKDEINRTRR